MRQVWRDVLGNFGCFSWNGEYEEWMAAWFQTALGLALLKDTISGRAEYPAHTKESCGRFGLPERYYFGRMLFCETSPSGADIRTGRACIVRCGFGIVTGLPPILPVHFVRRTQRALVLPDAVIHNPLVADEDKRFVVHFLYVIYGFRENAGTGLVVWVMQ